MADPYPAVLTVIRKCEGSLSTSRGPRHHALMTSPDRIYRRTDTGYKAWASDKSGLPVPYRRILGIVERETDFRTLCARMAPYEEREVEQWIDELETLGFVQCDSASVQLDLASKSFSSSSERNLRRCSGLGRPE